LASKRVVYVGGLAEKATAVGLRAVFIPFGSIRSIDVVR
jgi:RNA recognition motif-containing protein